MATPYSIIEVAVTDSTQDDARAAFVGTPVLVVAASQRRGRGRSGSGWVDADRSVAMSLACSPSWPVDRWSTIPLAVGVAMADVIGCSLKWPNDLIRNDSKLGGILVEASGDLVVSGVGLNLWWREPIEGAAALNDRDPGAGEGSRIARAWAEATLRFLQRPEWPHDRYRSLCATLGRHVSWEPEGAGQAIDVADDGALVVRTSAGTVSLRSGAIRHLRMR
jgi:BirA family biotin operon repressor/biotin-[acetyl-CoA-carboxylase] ligase